MNNFISFNIYSTRTFNDIVYNKKYEVFMCKFMKSNFNNF